MPIYEYRCNSCGCEKEHLQKISDTPISFCPACGSADYHKLISAAGFQLKGSGWYVTDFKNSKNQKTEAKQSSTKQEKTTKPADNSASTKTSAAATNN